MNGDTQPTQGPSVPTGASTPPFNPSIEGQQQDPARKLIELVLAASKGKSNLAQPVPAPIPPRQEAQDPTPPGAWQPAWGFQRFASQLGSTIQNTISVLKMTISS